MINRRDIVLIIATVAAFLVGHKLVVRIFWRNQADQHPADAMIIKRHGPLGSYNFQRSLALIEKTHKIKRTFRGQFSDPHGDQQYSLKELKEFLAELYRESIRLTKYIEAARTLSRRGLSDREYRTLLYYQRVLDRSIAGLEDIVRTM